jgi:hypothetical protein
MLLLLVFIWSLPAVIATPEEELENKHEDVVRSSATIS